MTRYISDTLKKQLLDETTHRCGLCLKRVGINAEEYDIAHIVPHSESCDNSFENLIILCVSCHSSYTRKLKDVEETSRLKKIKKHWLQLGKYYQIELDCLFDLYLNNSCPWISRSAVKNNQNQNIPSIVIPKNNLFLFKNVIQDKLVQLVSGNGGVSISGMDVSPVYLAFTDKGYDFCKKIIS